MVLLNLNKNVIFTPQHISFALVGDCTTYSVNAIIDKVEESTELNPKPPKKCYKKIISMVVKVLICVR